MRCRFDDRIEIVSPGHLPDNLTVEKIRAGNSDIRNLILVSHIAKGLLPYRGLASGIQRALGGCGSIGGTRSARCMWKPPTRPWMS